MNEQVNKNVSMKSYGSHTGPITYEPMPLHMNECTNKHMYLQGHIHILS